MATSAVGPIAALDSAVLAGFNCDEYLTPRERQESLRFRASVRKNEWLAARLASKFLFLTGQGGAIDASDLRGFSPEEYRSIEVTRDDRVNFGRPEARRADERRSLAISHAGGTACVALGGAETIAIDVERVEARSETFYRGNFTQWERAMAAEYFRRLDLSPHWTLTLFWGIKECLLKTPVYNDLSVWDMPSIEVRIVAGADDLVRVHAAPVFSSSDFVFLSVEAASRIGTEMRCVAVAGWRDQVITVVRGEDRRTV